MTAPTMDFPSVLLLVGAAQGIFFALLLYRTKTENRTANRILCILLLLFTTSLIDGFMDRTGYYLLFPHLIGVEWLTNPVYGPVVYFYIRELTKWGEKRTWKQALHFVPAAAFFVILVPLFRLTADEKIRGWLRLNDPARQTPASGFDPLTAALTVQISIYLVLSLRLLLAHSARVKENYSSVERISLSWLRDLIVACAILWVLYAFMNLFSPALGVWREANYLISLAIAVVIFVMGYKGLRQPAVFFPSNSRPSNVEEEASASVPWKQTKPEDPQETGIDEPSPESVKKYRKSSLSSVQSESIHQRLLQLMEKEKPFLDPELTLHSLSERLGVSPNHLSQVINGRLNRSFFDFVNENRVQEAIRLLADPESTRLSVLGIALDSGFNSKSAFYTAFRKHAGMTPTRYKEQLLADSPPH